MKLPKVKQIKKNNTYCLKDVANNIEVTKYRDTKFSKSEINLTQFVLELKRI